MTPKSKPRVDLKDGQVLPFISASFLFKDDEGKAGQTTPGQLAITSNAHPGSVPVVLSRLQVDFSGSIKSVMLRHKEGATKVPKHGTTTISALSLTDTTVDDASDDDDSVSESSDSSELTKKATLQGAADITLLPGQTLVFVLAVPLREPGETSAVSVTATIESEAFDLHHTLRFPEQGNANIWYLSAASKKRIPRANPVSIRVLPRPPKMEIKSSIWKEHYYTNEPIDIEFEFLNKEELPAPSKLDVVLFGQTVPPFTVYMEDKKSESTTTKTENGTEESKVSALSLGAIESFGSLVLRLRIPAVEHSNQLNLTIRVVYHLPSNPGTPITKTAAYLLNVVNPFEANYELLPRVHPDPWPSVFDYDGVQPILPPNAPPADNTIAAAAPAKGLSQAWKLVTRYASFASEDLRIVDVDIVTKTSRSVRCSSTKHKPTSALKSENDDEEKGLIIKPQTMQEASFDIVAQKSSLDDRGPSPLDVSLVIKWSRLRPTPPSPEEITASGGSSSPTVVVNTTTLPVPRYGIFGIEPRVLASVEHPLLGNGHEGVGGGVKVILLKVMIENASNHFLTFGLTMAPSDEFAFSGPKETALNLLPVSRREVSWRLVVPPRSAGSREEEKEEEGGLVEEGGRWIRPNLVVIDKYFQKVLRVIPTEGTRVDPAPAGGKEAGGFLIWVPDGE